MTDIILSLTELPKRQSIHPEMDATTARDDVKANAEIQPLQNANSSSCSCLENWCNQKCTLKLLKRRLPIVEWLPKYSVEDLKGDLIAGITVALTVIPQGLALAMLAGLPPQYGLYTAFMGCFMYTVFGSCKDLTIGPTAIMSLMTSEHTAAGGVTYVILITFLSGCIQLLMGILNLGFLVTFISSSVVSGFTSAAAITIAMTQLAGVFGLYFKSEGFTEDVYHFFNGIKDGNMRYWDMTLGLSSIVFLLLLKCGSKINIRCNTFTYTGRICDTLLKTVSTARNALLVLLCTGIAALLLSHGIDSLTLTQAVKPGLPSFAFPSFEYTYFNNATNTTVHKNFAVIVQEIGSGLIIIPLLCLLEAIAIAKSFAKGKKLDATQEMIAIGICNIMGSFVLAYPATGSFSRTAINYSSGVRTTAGGIVTGSLVLLALGVMSPYFCYIPKASLSALIFMAVLNMVHYKDVIIMWKTNKLDLLPFSATFIFSFILGLEYGIMIGIGISLGLLLLQESSVKLLIEDRKTFFGNSFLYVKPDRTVLFPSAECLQTKIIKSIPAYPHLSFNFTILAVLGLLFNADEENYRRDQNLYYIIIDCEHITAADYTMAMSMCSLINNMGNEGIKIIFINLRSNVMRAIAGTKPVEFHHHLSQEDAENFIDALSICQNSPPAYSGDGSRHSLRSDDVSFDS